MNNFRSTITGMIGVLRLALLAASTVASGFAIREKVKQQVASQVDREISKAVTDARLEIKSQLKHVLSSWWFMFLRSALVRIVLVSSLLFLGRLTETPKSLILLLLAVALVAMFVVDTIRAFPTLKYVVGEVRKYGLHPIRTFKKTIAALVFSKVIVEAEKLPDTVSRRVFLLLSGHRRSSLVERIASEVSELTAETSLSDLRPTLFFFFFKVWFVMTIYSVTIIALITYA